MSVNYLLKRTATANKRPTASQLDVGEVALNYEGGDPGLYFEDSNGVIRKIGPATVGSTAPNSSPAGQAGNSSGELWFDNSNSGSVLKVWDGSAWVTNAIAGLTSAATTATLTIDSSNRVGIGTASPTAQLELSGEGANASRFFITQANATTDGTDISGRRARGTIASPEALQANDSIFKVFAQGHDGSAYVASGNLGWTASDGNGNASFSLKTRVSGTVADRLVIDSSGNTTLSGTLSVSNGATIGTAVSPFQASAANDLVTKDFADSTYIPLANLTQGSIYLGNASNVATSSNFTLTMVAALAAQDFIISPGYLYLGFSTTIKDGQQLMMAEDVENGTNTVGFRAPESVTTTTLFFLPDGDGNAGQVIKTDGAANLSWVDVPTGIADTSTSTVLTLTNTTAKFETDIIQTPSASIDPDSNGDLVIEATSNTSITFKLKGSDGTVRTGTVTLS